MFDIGFWELAVIMIVGLVVIGPDKLPGIARSAGKWVGKARYFISSVKQDVQKELRAEELKQAIERDAGLDEIKEIMNTDKFSLEEETDYSSGYLVDAIDDDPHNPNASTTTESASVKDNEVTKKQNSDDSISNSNT